MAGNTRRNWSTDDLQAAVSAVKNDKISLRRAEGVYGVPKSTIAFYVHGMAKLQSVINQDLRPFLLFPKKQDWLNMLFT